MNAIFKSALLIALSGLMGAPGFSQGVEVSFGINRAGFRMEELKSFQESLRKSLPVPAKVGKNYPSYWGYEAHIDVNIKRFQVGGYYAFNSTGSKLSYSDYSGVVYYDQEIQVRQFGVSAHYSISRYSKVQAALLLEVGMGSTDFQFQEYLKIGSGPESELKLEFESQSITIAPGISLKYVLADRFIFKGELKYLMDNPKSLTWTDDDQIHLLDGTDTVGPDWSGVRIALLVGIRFHK